MRASELAFVAALLLFAAALRLVGIDFGQPDMALYPSDAARNFLPLEAPIHPDEYFYVAIPLDMLSRRRLDPEFFENPAFLIDLNFVTDWLSGAGTGLTPDTFRGVNQRQFAPFPFYVVGRVYSALGGLIAVAAAYAAARLLGGKFAAAGAGLLAAVSLPLVQHAHYATTSSLAAGFGMVSVWAGLVFWRRRGARWLVLAGIAAGLATANRYNAGIFVVIAAAVGLLDWWQRRTRRGLLVTAAGVVAAGCAFIVTNPYSLIHFSRFWQDFRYITGSYNAGTNVAFPAVNGLLYEYRYLIVVGLGIPAALLALIGGLRLWRFRFALALVAGLAIYSLIVLRPLRPAHSDQLLVPVIPIFCLFAGIGVRAFARSRLVAAGLVVLIAIMPLAITLPVVRALAQPDTRLVMAQWIDDHLPPGASIYLLGSYNIPLDSAAYNWTQVYGTDIPSLADSPARTVDYVVRSDALFNDAERSSEFVPADAIQQMRDALATYDALPVVARLDRPALIGDDWLMFTAAVWHHPGLTIYCVTPASCAAVR